MLEEKGGEEELKVAGYRVDLLEENKSKQGDG
jgi:hypothetical protein